MLQNKWVQMEEGCAPTPEKNWRPVHKKLAPPLFQRSLHVRSGLHESWKELEVLVRYFYRQMALLSPNQRRQSTWRNSIFHRIFKNKKATLGDISSFFQDFRTIFKEHRPAVQQLASVNAHVAVCRQFMAANADGWYEQQQREHIPGGGSGGRKWAERVEEFGAKEDVRGMLGDRHGDSRFRYVYERYRADDLEALSLVRARLAVRTNALQNTHLIWYNECKINRI